MAEEPVRYSVIVPTYNEKENLPIIIWLLVKHMPAKYAPLSSAHPRSGFHPECQVLVIIHSASGVFTQSLDPPTHYLWNFQ